MFTIKEIEHNSITDHNQLLYNDELLSATNLAMVEENLPLALETNVYEAIITALSAELKVSLPQEKIIGIIFHIGELFPKLASLISAQINDNYSPEYLLNILANSPDSEINQISQLKNSLVDLYQPLNMHNTSDKELHNAHKKEIYDMIIYLPCMIYLYICDFLFELNFKKNLSDKKHNEIKHFALYIEDDLFLILDKLDNKSKAVVFAIIFSTVINNDAPVYKMLNVLKDYICHSTDSSPLDLLASFNDWLYSSEHSESYANGLGAFYQIIMDKCGTFFNNQTWYNNDMLNDILNAIMSSTNLSQ